MNKSFDLASFFERNPIISVLVLAISVLLIQYSPGFFAPDLSHHTQKWIGKIFISILAIGLISLTGWWRETGFTSPIHWKNLKPYLPLLLLPAILAILNDFTVSDPAEIILTVVYVLIVGFAEEILARGLFLRIFQPLGTIQALWFSAVVFGLMHFGNLLFGTNFGITFTQVIYATLIGVAFAGTFTLGKSIWPLVIIHALINLISGLSGSDKTVAVFNPINSLLMIGIQVPFALYGLWLVRHLAHPNHLINEHSA